MSQALGRLERVELRHVWESEASHFTPWLGLAENLSILGEALGIELELEAQEKSVGPFRADLLCKDVGTGAWVLIENQLERTDHGHLGQLLTYASGLEAVTIVWVASRFTEEHRSTLDWLNRITAPSFNFFGLEVELWRIGSSPAAPKFNVIAKPNDWARSVAQAARSIEDGQLSDVRLLQREYWAALNVELDRVGGPVSGHRKPQPQSWMSYSIGRSHCQLAAVMIRPKRCLRAELYLSGDRAKEFFHRLLAQKHEVESELDFELEWEELPEGTDSRIGRYLKDVDPTEVDDWGRQHDWFASTLNAMRGVFGPRVQAL